jgi:hypothetical protein
VAGLNDNKIRKYEVLWSINRKCNTKNSTQSWSYGSRIYNLPITTTVVSSNPLRRDVLDTTLWPLRSNWNIVESGVKQHNPNPNPYPRTLIFFKPRKLISQNLNELTNSILNICNFFFSQNIILQLIQVHRETDLMETMEVKYFRKTLYPTTL